MRSPLKQSLPVIDISPLFQIGQAGNSSSVAGSEKVAHEIEIACRQSGFFYVKGHGISAGVFQQLVKLSDQFFALPESEKMEIGRLPYAGT